MTIGYLADAFDLINVRDLDLIAQAASSCSRLIVGVYSDAYATELFGRAPVVPLSERLAIVGHVRGVSQAVVHDDVMGGLDLTPDSGRILQFIGSDRAGTDVLISDDVAVLVPARETTSGVLRSALAPVCDIESEAVA